MNASELMTVDPVIVNPTSSIEAAIELLQEMTIRHLPVVNESGELVGIVSDRDLRALLVPYFHPQEVRETALARAGSPVSTIMSSDVVCASLEDDISVVTDLVLEHRVGAVPIVDAERLLVGIISYIDLLRYYARGGQ